MPRRKGTGNTPQKIINEIIQKHAEGFTKTELSKQYNKPFKTIRNMITRENNKKRRTEQGMPIRKQRGCKPAVTLQEYKYENMRLKMENELLRDFLHLAGRK